MPIEYVRYDVTIIFIWEIVYLDQFLRATYLEDKVRACWCITRLIHELLKFKILQTKLSYLALGYCGLEPLLSRFVICLM